MPNPSPIVALTGATGFLGRRVLDRLVSQGRKVVVLSRRRPANPGARWVPCDLAAGPVRAIPEGAVVVHIAALMPDRTNAFDYDRHITHTVQSTSHLLQAAERAASVVLVSSVDVYGTLHALPADEGHVTVPHTVYGACKLASEHLLRVACGRSGVPLSILRLAQMYGPGEPVIKAIPWFIAALQDESTITVANGGRDTRDYLYVDDAAAAVVAAVERHPDGVFNIAGGREVAVLEVATILAGLSGRTRCVAVAPPSGPVSRAWFSIDAARQHLGFSPAVSIEQGLARHYAAALASRREARALFA